MTTTVTADLLDSDNVVARFDPVLGLDVHVERPWNRRSGSALR
jgi:hypothetical protein